MVLDEIIVAAVSAAVPVVLTAVLPTKCCAWPGSVKTPSTERKVDAHKAEVRKWVAQLRCGGDGQKEQAARELCNLASNSDNNKVAIAEAGGIAPLVALVLVGTDGQKEKAALALKVLATNNADNKVAIARAGGIAPLVALARDGTDGQKEKAAGALKVLQSRQKEAVERSRRQAEEELPARTAQLQVAVAAAEAGDFAPLVALVLVGTDGQKEKAALALKVLATNNADKKVAIARAGGIAPLVALARDGTDGQKEKAAGALSKLACYNNDIKVAIAMEQLRSGGYGQKYEAAGALAVLARKNADSQVAIARAGGIAPLVALARDGTKPQLGTRAAEALKNLARNADIKVALARAGWR